MKKIGLVIIMIVLLATVANAASINGEFEGNPIIKMKSNGKALAVEDVPAILYNGRTMVPVGVLRDLGVTVEWDQKTQSVDVAVNASKNEPIPVQSFDPVQKTKEIISSGGGGVTLVEVAGQMTAVTYFSSINGFNSDWNKITAIIGMLTDFGATYSRVVYVEDNNDNLIEIRTQTYKDFISGKITDIPNPWITSGPIFDKKMPVDNTAVCSIINKKYDDLIRTKKEEMNSRGLLDSSLTQTAIDSFNKERANELTLYDCPESSNFRNQSNTTPETSQYLVSFCESINKKYDNLIRVTEESLGSSGFGRSSIMTDKINAIEEDRINELTLYGCQQ